MELDIDFIKEYLSKQPVDKAWLFGSFARGDADEKSDVDLLVSFTKSERIGMKFIKIINELEDILNREVDLVEEKTLLPWLRPFVEKDKILIYERKG